jgi:hypothetical protein
MHMSHHLCGADCQLKSKHPVSPIVNVSNCSHSCPSLWGDTATPAHDYKLYLNLKLYHYMQSKSNKRRARKKRVKEKYRQQFLVAIERWGTTLSLNADDNRASLVLVLSALNTKVLNNFLIDIQCLRLGFGPMTNGVGYGHSKLIIQTVESILIERIVL